MELMNPWVKQGWEEGIQTGIQKGKEELVVLQLKHRFGSVSSEMAERLNDLSSEQLNELAEALLDFKTTADLQIWLSRNNTQ